MTIGEICNKEVNTIQENSTIKDAAKLMAEQNIGFLVVTSENSTKPIGAITDRDIVIKALAKEEDNIIKTKVSEIMCKDILTLKEDQGINEIIELMSKKRVRRAPVVSNDRVTGIVSIDDLLPMLAKEINDIAQIQREQIQEA